ncbi:YggS family pyridoxal phosphate-dependent enzyme [Telmatospirillum siberiense]|uniref:YggS family pyridoxal phosphate-dependent enzyme n=1 Tax=Telmatospirillum siberiense TaxID=382514 RepID=UPI0026B6AC5C
MVTDDSQADVLAQYQAVTDELAAAEAAAGRPGGSVRLVAVSKTHPASRIRPLLERGHRLFGENRVQEAEEKWPALRSDFPDLELHLIGPLQTNKVREAVALFDVIETVDRPKLADALAREMERTGRSLRCLVQINTGAEPQKAGVLPEEADAFIEECRHRRRLAVEGLMCIPPQADDPMVHFRMLAAMAHRHGLPILSMGMSGDYPRAIAAGATHVRVGTAIFGHR